MSRRPARAVALVFVVAALALASCQAGTLRRSSRGERERPAGILNLQWRTVIHKHGMFEPPPNECAEAVVVDDRVILGSRGARVVGVDAKHGQIVWSHKTDGGIDGPAVYDPMTRSVLLGTDDGTLVAIDPRRGALRWSYKAVGAIEVAPEIADGRVFVSTSDDKLYALSTSDGKHLWQYDRERPDGFTIHGYAAPRVHDNRLFAGFSDGFLVALAPDNGEILWARSLAAASDQFVDVDATPTFLGEDVIAASYSGGLYALAQTDGAVSWRLPIEGAARTRMVQDRLYFVAPREGLHAVDPKNGHVLWRRGLPNAGDVTAPRALGPYLVFSGSTSGVHVVDRQTGRVLQTFLPGRGMCAAPAVDEERRMIYVLSNGGSLYALSVDW